MKIKILVITALFAVNSTGRIFAQEPFRKVLEQVEINNPQIAAQLKLAEAQGLEVRSGNNLEDPYVEYQHLWGNRSELGSEGELTVTQAFDFPTVYANRNRVARAREEQFSHEYQAVRKQVLLEAKSVCIEIIALRQRLDCLLSAVYSAKQIAETTTKKVEAGESNILEQNKAYAEMVSATNAFVESELEFASAENRLRALNGNVEISFLETEFALLPPLPDFEELLISYETRYPELLAVISNREAAESELKLSKSQSLPKFGMGYKYTHALGERFNGVVVGMSIPIFANRNNVKRARAEAAYADAELRRVKLDLASQLRQTYTHANILEGTIAEYGQMLDDKQATELLKKAFHAGHISVSQYYTEVQPLIESRLVYINLQQEYYLLRARLEMLEL